LFVEDDREAFYNFFESCSDMLDEAVEAMPSTDKEILPLLRSKRAQLAPPGTIKAAEQGIEELGPAMTFAREAREYFEVAAEGR
jgi:hypothetical protein